MTDPKPTVAIFGASGHLGYHISKAFVEGDIRKSFQDIVLFTRDASKVPFELEKWRGSGVAKIENVASKASAIQEQLKDVDVVVNTVPAGGDALRTEIVHAIAKSQVKLYFPSEYGVDHTVHDFAHPEWNKKKVHYKLAQDLLQTTKICLVYAGLFLEDSIGPWFGFDTRTDKYECYGSSNIKVSYTSLDDVGKAVASLALMPLRQVPLRVHLSGDLASVKDIAVLMQSKSGEQIRVVELPLEENREKELRNQRPDPSGCLRFLMGEGKIKHSAEGLGVDNELVNPRESRWRWKKLSDLAEETNGRPWVDATWS